MQPSCIKRHFEAVPSCPETCGFHILTMKIGNDTAGNDLTTDQYIDYYRHVAARPSNPSVDPAPIGEINVPLSLLRYRSAGKSQQ